MKRTQPWWSRILAVAVCLATGLGAGNARAQVEGDGGWFEAGGIDEGEGESPRPLLRIHGTGPYEPPPPDFQSEPPRDDWQDTEATESDDAEEPEDDADAQTRALSEFSPHLSAYGYWVDDSVYGRVWVPARKVVGPDFAPYVSGGHWELSVDDEWTWVSDYPFGWITFHYGRWVWMGGAGWAWVPGYRYSPAWVDFRIGVGGYVGWGALPPYYGWRGGAYVWFGMRYPSHYTYCATHYAFSHSLHRHVIRDRHRVNALAADTYRYRPHRVSGNSRLVRGPSAAEARIPSRALPSRRTIARPRLGERSSDDRSTSGRGQGRQRSYERHGSGASFDRARPSARRGHGDDRASGRGTVPTMSSDRGGQRSRGERASPTRRGTIDHGNPAYRSTLPNARSREAQQEPSRGSVRRSERSSGGRSSGSARSRSSRARGTSAATLRMHQRGGRDGGGRDGGGSRR